MYHSVKRHERELFARQMDEFVAAGTAVYADFDGTGDTNSRRRFAVTFDDAYHSVLENALPILQERGIPPTIFVPTQYVGKRPGWIVDPRHRDAQERLLTAGELRQVWEMGGLIGSHGATHRPLARLSVAEALAELTESRRVLSDLIGKPVDLFALPYGSADTEVLCLATRAGYSRVFLNVPHRTDGLSLPVVGRVDVTPTDWPLEYRLKMRGAYRWLPMAIAVKRRLRMVRRMVSFRTTAMFPG
jgi:peptidoglycan/xylan/chitin deacetylase (PgdA/CDA1 family)